MTKSNDKERLLRSSVLAGFAAILIASPAIAQDESNSDDQPKDEIVVTGSLLHKNEYNSAAPVQVLTAETAVLEGQLDTTEILQTASVAAGSTQINSQLGGFVIDGGTGVNSISLRGLGAQRTLVLLNGRRLGPAGTRGAVAAVDLNVLPASIVNRVEILKDGASSIYGSDAVAGVVNVITRNQLKGAEFNASTSVPFAGGGEVYTVDGAIGHQFGPLQLTVSGSYQKLEDLDIGDRDYLSCDLDYLFDTNGNRIDDIEQYKGSPRYGQPKCFNMLNNVYDVFSYYQGTVRFTPDPDLTVGDVPGYRPRGYTGVSPSYLETPYRDPKTLNEDALFSAERYNVFSTADMDLAAGVSAYAEVLYSHRKTHSDAWRQFFPWVGNYNPFVPTDDGAFGAGSVYVARPIAVIPFNQDVTVDYYNVVVGFKGDVPGTKTWSWDAYVDYSNSDGTYVTDTVPASNVEDYFDSRTDVVTYFNGTDIVCERYSDGSACPVINYFSPEFLSGNYSDEVKNFLFAKDVGNTQYEQFVARVVATGELIQLPAGPAQLAVGAEYRSFAIDDVPGQYSIAGNQWGLTSAGRTVGSDSAKEAFAEMEVPIIKGITANGSVRWSDYETYGSNAVYKAGANWAINDVFRVRGTYGTSYRTPALYELFLGDQTGFLGQTSIDPCIMWRDSQNPNIQANCAAAGIPDDYAGIGSSALVYTGGGFGVLEAEDSDALTLGAIFTPRGIDFSLALDYFEIQVNNEISQLSAGSILGRCYGGDTYPNTFCDLFTRDTNPTSPSYLNIIDVHSSYVNIDTQKTRGLDLTARYRRDTPLGEFTGQVQGTWTFEETLVIFEGSTLDFNTTDYNGTVGDPEFVGNGQFSLENGHWTYTWFMDYIGGTSNRSLYSAPFEGYKYEAETTIYHGFSVRYERDSWTVVAGIRNLFDEAPPALSTGVGASRRGTTPIFATQYDLKGRTGFIQLKKTFGG